MARRPDELLLFTTSSSLAHHQHPRICLRTHPQHARTHHHHERLAIAFPSFLQRPLSCSASCADPTPLESRSAQTSFLFFFRAPTLLLAGRSFFLCFALRRPLFLSACFALRRALRLPARKNPLASARIEDRRTNDATCGPQAAAGMADWKTALGGNTERTLTAAAGPSPRDPYRQALTMRPSLKVRPLVS